MSFLFFLPLSTIDFLSCFLFLSSPLHPLSLIYFPRHIISFPLFFSLLPLSLSLSALFWSLLPWDIKSWSIFPSPARTVSQTNPVKFLTEEILELDLNERLQKMKKGEKKCRKFKKRCRVMVTPLFLTPSLITVIYELNVCVPSLPRVLCWSSDITKWWHLEVAFGQKLGLDEVFRVEPTLKMGLKWKWSTLCDPMDSSLHQAPPSIGFWRQEYWSGLPFPSPGNLPNPGIKPRSLTL